MNQKRGAGFLRRVAYFRRVKAHNNPNKRSALPPQSGFPATGTGVGWGAAVGTGAVFSGAAMRVGVGRIGNGVEVTSATGVTVGTCGAVVGVVVRIKKS